MSPRIVGIVYRKELLETLRDRRTLVVMVVLPLCLYPIVGIGITQVVGSQEARRGQQSSRVALRGPDWPELQRSLVDGKQIELGREHATEQSVREGRVDLLLTVPPKLQQTLARDGTVKLELVYDDTRERSRLAHKRVTQEVERLARKIVQRRLKGHGLSRELVRPLTTGEKRVGTAHGRGAQLMARVVPMLVILMVLLGAFYPAIDVTAGEKERGTLETLLAAPVDRISLMAGKYLVVATAGVITGLLNLGSIGLTLSLGFGPALRAAGVASQDVPWSAVLLTVVAMVPAALFFAAILIAIAALGRSFKEAQNLLTPVLLVCQLPALVAQVPGIELNLFTAVIPVVNVSLLTRDLIAGRTAWLPAGVTILSLALYTVVALKLAARIFVGERLLFAPDPGAGKRRGIWGALLPHRGDRPPAEAPTPTQASLLFLVVMALILLVGQPMQARHLVAGLLVTEWVLIALPVLLLVWLGRVRLAGALALNRPAPAAMLGALLTGLSAWYLVGMLVETVQQRVMPMPPEMVREYHRALFSAERGLALDLFVLALSPAVCEELLFRGVLLQGTRRSMSPTWTVVVNGLLFGLFHISPYRFVSTMILGMVLALIVLRAGSILPGMLFHLLNNASAIVVGRLMGSQAVTSTSEPVLSWPLLSAAALLFALGLGLVFRAGPSGPRDPAG